MIEHPAIARTIQTGYPSPPIRNPRPITTACDVCDTFEARVRFNKTKLCDSCASEEGIEVI